MAAIAAYSARQRRKGRALRSTARRRTISSPRNGSRLRPGPTNPPRNTFFGQLYDRDLGVAQDFVLAEAWLEIAVARAEPLWRRSWALSRDAVASKLSRADLEEAQRLAADWRRP